MENDNKLYVGSLPYKTTEQDLMEIFTQYGTVVSVKIVPDRVTGKSKGFGFVTMSTSDEAQKALEAVNGSDLDGRTLVVNKARPHQPREQHGNKWQKSNFSRGPSY